MRVSITAALCALLTLTLIPFVHAQQFLGAPIANQSLQGVPGSEITFWNILDKNKKNTTLINYSSLDLQGNRLVPSNIQRAVIFIHGLQRDAGTYMSNMLVAMAQLQVPQVNRSNVQIVAPMFANGDDKYTAYPYNTSLTTGRSTSRALVWSGSGWVSVEHVT